MTTIGRLPPNVHLSMQYSTSEWFIWWPMFTHLPDVTKSVAAHSTEDPPVFITCMNKTTGPSCALQLLQHRRPQK
jgi:hypothetical protein